MECRLDVLHAAGSGAGCGSVKLNPGRTITPGLAGMAAAATVARLYGGWLVDVKLRAAAAATTGITMSPVFSQRKLLCEFVSFQRMC